MAITAKDVMALRQRTGMGMMECKAALNEAGGDMEAAVDILRVSAKGKMDERTDRAAAEGVVAIATDNGQATIIELDCETDFVARNDDFVAVADRIAQHALSAAGGEVAADDQITKMVDDVRITTKENVSFARGSKVEGAQIGTYVHHNRKVGALIVLEGGSVDADIVAGLAQHVTALDGVMLPVPLSIDESGLPAEQVEAAKVEFTEEAKSTGKPAEIAEKIASGKMRKWIEERTLVNQAYVKDMTGKTTVKQALNGAAIKQYVRYQVGG